MTAATKPPIARAGVLVLTVLLMVSIAACGSEEPEAWTDDRAPVSVQVAELTERSHPRQFRFTGTVEGSERIPLSTRIMGRVDEVRVTEGTPVSEGQVLARISDRDIRAQRRQVEAQQREAEVALQNARTQFARIDTLLQRGSATQQAYDNAKAGYERAQARVEALANRLDEIDESLTYTTIMAPAAGTIIAQHVEQGAMAAPGQPLLTLEASGVLEVRTRVPERHIGAMAVGDTVRVNIGAANETLTGRVTEVNPSGDPASRQFHMRVLLSDPPASVKSGMYAQVFHETGERLMFTVPTSSLVARGQLTGVYAVGDDDRALLRWIRTGTQRGDAVEVLSGLQQGDRYVVQADGRLRDGHPITIQD
jgi:RND family efflux transporter MFP subunit